ncbi:ABC transporter, partial [Candidatus Saccharibacteria bacterium]
VSDMMYEHFLSLDYWQYDDKDTVDLYDRAQKFAQFYAYVFDRLASVLSQLVTLILSLIGLAVFLPFIALIVLAAVIPGVFIQFKLSRAQINHWNKNVDVRRAKGYIEWNLLQPNAIAELKLNGLVRYFMDLRNKLRNKDERARLDYERRFIGWRLAADVLEAMAELFALVWVAMQIIARQLPIGQFVYAQQLVSRAIGGANRFVSELSTIDEDLANLYDYQTFMNLPTKNGGTIILKETPQRIEFKDVSFQYPNSKKSVLSNVSFTISKGQHIAIVGENGAGKSTLIKLLTGLYYPTSGNILLDDIALADVRLDSWHGQLSILQQDFEQYVFTNIRDNVFFGDVNKPLNEDRIITSLEQSEALDFVNKLPKGLDTFPHAWMEDSEGNKGTTISGGQWQRIALARNFYRNAPIIILDEPTSAIDALAEARIFDRLFAKTNNKTVITISHRLSTVQKADLIIVLEEGRIVETGTHTELVATKSHYYKLFERQLV